jgi:hypothetical protein
VADLTQIEFSFLICPGMGTVLTPIYNLAIWIEKLDFFPRKALDLASWQP